MACRKNKKTEIQPDPLYNDIVVAKFINHILKRGKKTVAQKIVYGSFDIIKKNTKREPLEVFRDAVQNVSPLLEVKSKRVGGATYQVPTEVKGERRLGVAMKWIINSAKAKKGKKMAEHLAQELTDASENKGEAIKKKENAHRMAEANRAFAHFSF
ncbi:MAG: 30S ribosomal protein S7 [Candidatus Paceibacterota bacterium]|jgi:small subunit ribosomal protein S7|nr:30S ribosomal protein S7 [Candidatus Paceibacterota bacterium]MDD4830796.1 30S ribosomal protein S7 [Candidatus Paceibacterota bacterium]MDD4875282.1 30S ribosomal protein S7 [Candidatus Paceibacterota bacterium]